jgi:hypothetical protein
VISKEVLDEFLSIDGNRAVEIKDVAGPIDKEQYRAYRDMIRNEVTVAGRDGNVAVERLRYGTRSPAD